MSAAKDIEWEGEQKETKKEKKENLGKRESERESELWELGIEITAERLVDSGSKVLKEHNWENSKVDGWWSIDRETAREGQKEQQHQKEEIFGQTKTLSIDYLSSYLAFEKRKGNSFYHF